MEEFQVPENVSDPLALQAKNPGRFCASLDLPSLKDETSARLNDIVDSVGSRIADGDADALSEQENFDDMFSLVRDFKYLPSDIKGRVLQILHEAVRRTVPELGGEGGSSSSRKRRTSARGEGGRGVRHEEEEEGGQQGQGQAELSIRNAFKMSVYLLFSAAFPSEECYSSAKQTAGLAKQPAKGHGSRGGGGGKKSQSSDSGAFSWETARLAVLESMRLALTADPSRLWRQGVPDRSFMSLFLRLSCKMLELPETIAAKNIRQAELALRLISEPFRLSRSMESEVAAALFQLVREGKHLASFVAGLCCRLVDEHRDPRLGAELVREIGRMDMPEINSKNTAAAAPVINVSEFLRELVVVLPGTVHAHASVLLPHLSSRPYQIRQAVITSLAEVVAAAHEDKRAAAAAAPEEEAGKNGAAEGGSAAGGNAEEEESQVQADPRRVRMKDRNRDALLDQLVERVLDVSPFVRVAVLRAWGSIAERAALPRKRYLIAARLGRDRLRDQSSLVRKEAVKLLTTLLGYNPYNSDLDLKVNRERWEQAEAELRALTPAPATKPAPSCESGASRKGKSADDGQSNDGRGDGDGDAGEGDGESDGRREDGGDGEACEKEEDEDGPSEGGVGEAKAPEAAEDDAHGEAEAGEDTELTKKMEELADHLKAAVLFIEEFQQAGPRLEGLLGSTTVSDVVEALRYFVTACHFNVPGALEAIKKSLTLIWRTEAPIEAAIKRAFVQVFVQPDPATDGGGAPATEGGANAQFVAKNLVSLVNDSQAGELASLEEVVSSLVKDTLDKDKDTVLDLEVFEQLWCAVGRKGQLPRRRAGALHAIAMGASAEPSLVNGLARLEVIRETALGRVTMESRDWRTVRCACIALLRSDPASVMKSKEVELILQRLVYFLQGKWCVPVTGSTSDDERARADGEMETWFAAAEQAMAVLFHLNRSPEAIGAAVVRRVASDILSSDEASPHALARLCFVLGHLALKLLVYSEDLAGSLERARAKAKAPTREKEGTKKAAAGGGEDDEDEGDDDATAQELGLNAEAAAEDEQRLTELVEKEIVGRNLLGAFGPLLVRLVADERGRFAHPLLREASVLALSKFMCISEAFCERNLSLLFTTLERSNDPAVRTNIIVALGDLAFRFPNALEPWNPRIYDRLKDDSPGVRANAIMVLTHLILNDMIKVKGQVSGLAVCMVDEEPRIQDAAKVFFHKYSERGTNPVYNLLPDIVGHLSVDETVAPSEYKEIMDFLMQYVKKDKLTELLAEKLCARLAASESTRQARAVSYCIGQLKVTEKAVSRLADLVPTYKEKLQDEEVFKNFMVVVSRTKSFATVEMKEAVAEWQAQLSKYHEGGAEDEDAAARAASAAGRKRSRGGKRPSSSSSGGGGGSRNAGRAKTGAAVAAASAEAESSEGHESKAVEGSRRASSRSKEKRAKKKAAVVLSSDSEFDEDEQEQAEEDDDEGSEASQARDPVATEVQQAKKKGARGSKADLATAVEEQEEGAWGSEEEIFEAKTSNALVFSDKTTKIQRASKENHKAAAMVGKPPASAAAARGSRWSRNARPLSPKN